jgi:MraZ protein
VVESGVKWSKIIESEAYNLFYGEYQHTVDPKGRAIVPSKFREGLGEKFILTKGLDSCLFAYSSEEWTSLENKLKTLPFTDKDVRAFIRFFFSGATECEVDKQGRILIPQNLREYAALEKDIYIIGVSSRVEIWNKDTWEKYSSDDNISADKIAEKMALLGI